MKTASITSAGILLGSLLSTTSLHAATTVWQGDVSSDWGDADNWNAHYGQSQSENHPSTLFGKLKMLGEAQAHA